jgi:hypothetical protein
VDSTLADDPWVEVPGPIWAWRAHRLVLRGGEIQLAPAIAAGGPTWRPDQTQQFACASGCSRLEANCSCGLYAKRLPHFRELAELHIFRRGELVHGTPAAVALVRLGGRLFVRRDTVRAEWAKPVRVVPTCCFCVRHGQNTPPQAVRVCGHSDPSHLIPLCGFHLRRLVKLYRQPPHVTSSLTLLSPWRGYQGQPTRR